MNGRGVLPAAFFWRAWNRNPRGNAPDSEALAAGTKLLCKDKLANLLNDRHRRIQDLPLN